MMNKQLTKKTIGIAASAALMASLAFSTNALAERGGKSRTSMDVSSWCEITNVAEGELTVYVSLADKGTGKAFGAAQVDSAVVQGQSKSKGNTFNDIPGALATPDLMMDVADQAVTVNICGGASDKAINALTTITLDTTELPSSKPEYTAQCGDNPWTLDVIEGGLKTADYEGLCSAAP